MVAISPAYAILHDTNIGQVLPQHQEHGGASTAAPSMRVYTGASVRIASSQTPHYRILNDLGGSSAARAKEDWDSWEVWQHGEVSRGFGM